MNREFTAKLLRHLNNKKNKNNKGFTLIELLVVVIIIGVLAAVALPNLLSQVGKARETEAKNGVGTINRTQQSYHFEKQKFAESIDNATIGADNALGVIVKSRYFQFTIPAAGTSTASDATVAASALDAAKDGVRSYGGGIGFVTGNYTTVICQADTVDSTTSPNTDMTVTVSAGVADSSSCPASTTVIQ
jgi:type IV pilus assembly protein PilA